ncbi:MAG: mycofactocin system GMC family oxidoreductase MftG [Chloroflexi bacterium]|nr:mycofactocin system GMC family oxidoreductase MftG [Chloroflexota bacterium]
MPHYDTLIIGSGSAGGILAARLSEDESHRVLLLEAGPDYTSAESLPDDLRYGFGTPSGIFSVTHDWGYNATSTPAAPPIAIPRGRVIGGSSTVNATIFLRGIPEDFAHWVALGNDRWSWEAVLPYYRKIESDQDFHDEFHGSDGPIPVGRYGPEEWPEDQRAWYAACLAAGYPESPDMNRPGTTGVGPYPLNSRSRVRYSTALAYLLPARGRPNLTIRGNALVQRICFDGVRATGVEAVIDGGLEQISAGRVILCAGAIASPQLLMLSGVGPADHLHSLDIPVLLDRPGVGETLRDHPTAGLLWRVRSDFPANNSAHFHQVGLRYTASGSEFFNDMIVYFGVRPAEQTLFVRPTINLTLSAGRLRLTSTDVSVQPSLNYDYYSHPFDRQRQREAIRLCIALLDYPDFEKIVRAPLQHPGDALEDDDALDRWILRHADTGHHSSSTCKMGRESDPLAVVDQSGKVYGTEGLWVVDASILPETVRANINATVLMLAEKIADWLT